MNRERLAYFKRKLEMEKDNVSDLIKELNRSEIRNPDMEISQELSFYDNHPADTSNQVYEKEKAIALKDNETSILKKIEDALMLIQEGKYGKCQKCGIEIPEERLEFIPYAAFCVNCQKSTYGQELKNSHDRCVEEETIKYPFGYGYNDYSTSEETGFDAEDSYKSVENFNKRENMSYFNEEYDEFDEEGYVEPVEKISNEQYRNQLPD